MNNKSINLNMQELKVHAYDWVIQNDKEGTSINCWALNENSIPYLLRIIDFPVCYYLELPSNSINLNNDNINKILFELFKEYAPTEFELEYKKRLYYYNGDKLYPYLNITFESLFHFRKCLNRLKYNKDYNTIYKFVEEEINIIRKLLTIKNIKYSSWFKCFGIKVNDKDKISDIENEFIINWNSMTSIVQNITTHPGILAFDIESYSDNHRAMPDPLNSKHHAYMISCIYKKYKIPGSIRRFGIIFGESNDIPLENCKIYKVTKELDIISAFADIIKETKPEIITGYNILGFDYPYLNTRLERNLQDWPNISRINNRQTIMENRSWHSDAYGYQMINILKAEGIISIDMLPVIKREYKLDKYDLNTVCSKFINKTKHDVKAIEMFEIYERCMLDKDNLNNIDEMTKVMAYCIQDSELVIELFEKINCWESLVEMSNIVGITIEEVYTRGQQIRCVSQLYDLGYNENYILNKRSEKGFPYKGATVFEPIPGLYNNVICLDFASLYPSIIQAYNICYSTLVPEESFNKVNDEECNIVELEQETDEDEPNLTGKKILKKDIKKLTKKFTFKFYKGKEGLLPRLVKNLVSERRNVRKQIELLKNNKSEDNQIQILILDKRQLALKVSANSFYGFLGVHNNGKLPLIEGAMSITSLGRMLIDKVHNYIKDHYQGKLIYGDTDSVMMEIPSIKKSSECTYWGDKLAQEISGIKKGDKKYDGTIAEENINGIFPPPLSMEFEKAMRMLLLKKKKYASYLIEDDGNFKVEKGQKSLLLRGIVLVRRDNCAYLRELYKKILYMILDKKEIYKAINEIVLNIYNLKNGKIDINKLKIIKQLGSNYKSDNALLKVFSDDLKNDGKIMNPGDRLEYVVVKGDSKLRGHNLRLIEQFEENKEQIDYDYYIDNVLLNPINQLFSVGYKEELLKLNNIYLSYQNSNKKIYLDDIITFIQKYSIINYDYKNLINHIFKVPKNCKLNLE